MSAIVTSLLAFLKKWEIATHAALDMAADMAADMTIAGSQGNPPHPWGGFHPYSTDGPVPMNLFRTSS